MREKGGKSKSSRPEIRFSFSIGQLGPGSHSYHEEDCFEPNRLITL